MLFCCRILGLFRKPSEVALVELELYTGERFLRGRTLPELSESSKSYEVALTGNAVFFRRPLLTGRTPPEPSELSEPSLGLGANKVAEIKTNKNKNLIRTPNTRTSS